MSQETVSEIFADLGPADDQIMAVLRNGDAEWVVRYADANVEVTLVEADGRLVFAALCGLAPAYRTAAVNEMLLRFNAIWRDTGSVRMALSGEEGEVLLIADIPVSQASVSHVAMIARNVAGRSVAWRAIVEAGAPNDAPPPADLSDTHFLRA